MYVYARCFVQFCREHCVYVEIKCQLDATEVFIAVLIACSTCFGHHYAHHKELKSIIQWLIYGNRLCGLVVRVSGYRYRGPGFDSRRYQIF